MGIKYSNGAKSLGIRRALFVWARYGARALTVESEFVNAIKWVSERTKTLWRLITMVREIRDLCSKLAVFLLS